MSPKQTRAPTSSAKRRRYDEEDEQSDSELSDIEDEIDTTPAEVTAQEDDDTSSDDEEEDIEEDEATSDSDTADGEVEESYISEDPISDDESDIMKTKPSAKGVAQRAVTRGTRSKAPVKVTKKTPSKVGPRSDPAPPSKRLRQLPPRTRSSAAIGTRSSYQQQGNSKGKQSAATTGRPGSATKLKIATSASSVTPKTNAPRGRKIIQEESDEDEDEDDEDDDEMKVEDEEADMDDELGDEDAEGETDDELMDSDDDGTTPSFLSRTGTPDMSRLTNRQRTRMGDITTADLLELPSAFEKPGANKAVTLSAQEQELKRAEMARRRKNLTDQKLEEEKMDTINRLLKKQTPKMRGKGRATGDATPADQADLLMGETPQRPPVMTRWVSNKTGIRLAVPGSWLAGPLAKQFEPRQETESMCAVKRKLVEEL